MAAAQRCGVTCNFWLLTRRVASASGLRFEGKGRASDVPIVGDDGGSAIRITIDSVSVAARASFGGATYLMSNACAKLVEPR